MVARIAVTLLVLGVGVLVGWAQWRGADLSGAGTTTLLAVFGLAWALRQRDRNRPMRWRPAIRLPDGGTAAGLVAPLSRVEATWWLVAEAVLVVFVDGVAGRFAESGRWGGVTLGALAATAALWGLRRLFEDLPQIRTTAIVEDGVLWRGRLLRWAEIGSVRISTPVGDEDEGDVELRLAGPSRRLLDLTPPGSMIDPQELRVAVLTYLRTPERRPELNSPVDPRGTVALPGDPRPGGHPGGEAVQGGAEA